MTPPIARRSKRAELSFKAGKVELHASVAVTPVGLLAIGGLVSSIVLSTTVLVWASVSAAKTYRQAHRQP